MKVLPATLGDLAFMKVQPKQAHLFTPDGVEQALSIGEAYTAWDDGVLGVFGVVPLTEGRAVGWAVIAEKAGAHMLPITRAVRQFLSHSQIQRIECYVDPDFEQAIRWALCLDFQYEGYMRAFHKGQDVLMFARING